MTCCKGNESKWWKSKQKAGPRGWKVLKGCRKPGTGAGVKRQNKRKKGCVGPLRFKIHTTGVGPSSAGKSLSGQRVHSKWPEQSAKEREPTGGNFGKKHR